MWFLYVVSRYVVQKVGGGPLGTPHLYILLNFTIRG